MRPTQENSFVKVLFCLAIWVTHQSMLPARFFSILCAKRSSPLTFGCTFTSCPASQPQSRLLARAQRTEKACLTGLPTCPSTGQARATWGFVCVCVCRDVVLELEKMNKGKKTDSESQTGRGSFRRSYRRGRRS